MSWDKPLKKNNNITIGSSYLANIPYGPTTSWWQPDPHPILQIGTTVIIKTGDYCLLCKQSLKYNESLLLPLVCTDCYIKSKVPLLLSINSVKKKYLKDTKKLENKYKVLVKHAALHYLFFPLMQVE